ncbi:MAG TPA: 2-dehydro-3-deoxygalactonokinase [Cyclobacteriaceae bacterium]|nr:2-dehydro-3-deoxygalactonokinase [Cyclobacteriaceae bacterium]
MRRFLSCDWGTSNFRLRLVDADSATIMRQINSDDGISNTYNAWLKANLPESERVSFYKRVLHYACSQLLDTGDRNVPIVISGMASSSIGMMELPYSKFPLHVGVGELNVSAIESDEQFPYPILLVSGCCTDQDVMRGEETILLGCDVKDNTEAIFIFPGTHSKHVMVRNGLAENFTTYATGELFNLLSQKSILAKSVSPGDSEESFMKGIMDSQKENILHSIFSIRARHILHKTSTVENYQYLSGLIIGIELRDLKDTGSAIQIVSEEPLLHRYRLGLRGVGVRAEAVCLSANAALVKGHCEILNLIP